MKSIAAFATILLVASVNGASQRLLPKAGAAPTNIAMDAISLATGEGSAAATHDSAINVLGSAGNPAVLNVNTGAGSSLYQDANNYQQSIINADGSSSAYQGNYASNSAYANDYLSADAQGDAINANSNGWTQTQGSGAVQQAETLNHVGNPVGAGWLPTP